MARSRSRSPYTSKEHRTSAYGRANRRRDSTADSGSHSPPRDKRGQQRSYRRRSHNESKPPKHSAPRSRPFDATEIFKNDLSTHRPLFALYLDIQKQLDIEDLSPDEVKGRWKSFVKKWNNGDLAEGWYDPSTFEKARTGTFGIRPHDHQDTRSSEKDTRRVADVEIGDGDEDEDDRDYGPELPNHLLSRPSNQGGSQNDDKAGPSIPTTSDLTLRREQEREDRLASQNQYVDNIRADRKADRRLQRDRLDEIAPRAEAGTRERQLEKKKEIASSNRAFAASKEAGGDVELRDSEVMGEEDSLAEMKRMKEREKRKKTDREIKREELLRARAAEREVRLKGMREKEAKTMEMLKSIAQARFGGVPD